MWYIFGRPVSKCCFIITTLQGPFFYLTEWEITKRQATAAWKQQSVPLRASHGFLGFIMAESATHGHVSDRGVLRVRLMAVMLSTLRRFRPVCRQQIQRWEDIVTRGKLTCSCFTPKLQSFRKNKRDIFNDFQRLHRSFINGLFSTMVQDNKHNTMYTQF